MIFYLVTKNHAYTITRYLKSWGTTLAPRLKPVFYEQLKGLRALGPGTYIFSDIERLAPKQAERFAQLWQQNTNVGKGIRLLNHPTLSMKRYELLRTMYEQGWNQFNVYRPTECSRPERFPVFLRRENDHSGSLTPLLQTPEALDKAIAELSQRGQSRKENPIKAITRLFKLCRSQENILITEFCDTSDKQRIFRKYSAFIVADRIIPQHILFSLDWMLKSNARLLDEVTPREEQKYLETNPHESQLRKIFRLSRIEYGRIDYSININGHLQVWEINTNPTIFRCTNPESPRNVKRRSLREYFSKLFQAALEAID
ncbi:MAG: hypothetical protein GY797_20280 [Deltaproteobacteria bacterium]|nr:hypothetical protein [Deltaproteobacteria bacterium]